MNIHISKIFVLCMIIGVFGIGAAMAAPTLTWQTAPPASVTQGNDVTFDVSFSESTDYYIRIENSTNGLVWRSPASGTGHAANPTTKTWTTTTATPTGDYTIIININGSDNSDTRTVTVGTGVPSGPSVTIDPASTTELSPGDTFSININVDPDGNGVSSGQIDLSFDTSVLEVTNRVKGDMLGTDAFDIGSDYNNTAGTVTAVLARMGTTTPPTAAGTWATVTFQVKAGVADGTTTIAITSVGMVDDSFAAITGITTTGGTATIVALTGDISGDATVDYIDLGMLGASYGISVGDTGYNASADLSGDGIVNYIDLGMLGAHYGESA